MISRLWWRCRPLFFDERVIQFLLEAFLCLRGEKSAVSIVRTIGLGRIVIEFRGFALPTQVLLIDYLIMILHLNIRAVPWKTWQSFLFYDFRETTFRFLGSHYRLIRVSISFTNTLLYFAKTINIAINWAIRIHPTFHHNFFCMQSLSFPFSIFLHLNIQINSRFYFLIFDIHMIIGYPWISVILFRFDIDRNNWVFLIFLFAIIVVLCSGILRCSCFGLCSWL